jgi:hypothetical protein
LPEVSAYSRFNRTITRFKLRRQSIRLAVRPAASIRERRDAAVFIAIEDLVAGLPQGNKGALVCFP